MLDYSKIELLPQISNICWFNSILTVLLYSEGVRKILKENLFGTNKFLKSLLYIIDNNYTSPENIRKLFRGRFTTEFLLFTYLDIYKSPKLKEQLKKQLSRNIRLFIGNTFKFIIELLEKLEIKAQDLYYYDNNLHYNIYTMSKRTTSPDIILLFHEKTNPDINKDELSAPFSNYSSFISGIEEINEYITYNGVKYKLDSTILQNYNSDDKKINHVISGITYNNESYVYNGWRIDNYKFLDKTGVRKIKKSCPLFKFDWKKDIINTDNSKSKSKNDFCISINECKLLEIIDEKDLCFNFSRGNKVLIYVKVDETSSKSFISTKKDNIRSKSIKYTSQTLKPYLRSFYHLNDKSIVELKEILKQLKYNNIMIERITAENIKKNLNEKYKDLFKVNMSNTDENLIKKFIKKMIKANLKDDIIFDDVDLFGIDDKYINLLKTYSKSVLSSYLSNKDDNNKTIKELILFLFKRDIEPEILHKLINIITDKILFSRSISVSVSTSIKS
jgi:hypothetical protein